MIVAIGATAATARAQTVKKESFLGEWSGSIVGFSTANDPGGRGIRLAALSAEGTGKVAWMVNGKPWDRPNVVLEGDTLSLINKANSKVTLKRAGADELRGTMIFSNGEPHELSFKRQSFAAADGEYSGRSNTGPGCSAVWLKFTVTQGRISGVQSFLGSRQTGKSDISGMAWSDGTAELVLTKTGGGDTYTGVYGAKFENGTFSTNFPGKNCSHAFSLSR